MSKDGKDKFIEQIKGMPTEKLQEDLASGMYGGSPDTAYYNLVKFELDRRKEESEEIKLKKTFKIAEDNVNATRWLVKATWGLVIVTFLLVLATTLMPVVLKGCSECIKTN